MNRLALTLFLTTGALATGAIGACGDDEGGGGTGASSNPGCAPTDPACPALAIESDCLAVVDNSGKDHFALRLAQLSVSKPAELTGPLIYNIIADGINLSLESCNVNGMGTFSIIADFNKPLAL